MAEIDTGDIELIEMVIEGEDQFPIHCDLWTAGVELRRPLIIIAHGFLGYKRWGFIPYLASNLAESGFHALTVSFSMNGVDEETGQITDPRAFARNTINRELRDLRIVNRAAVDNNLPIQGDIDGIGLMGHSRGGGEAIIISSQCDRVGSLVTWSTLSTFDRYTERRKKKWKRDGVLNFHSDRADIPLKLNYSYYLDVDHNRENYNIRKYASRLKIPHLMIHGEQDAAVPLREAREVLENSGPGIRELEIIPGCGHAFGTTHPMKKPSGALRKAVEMTGEWFGKTLLENQE